MKNGMRGLLSAGLCALCFAHACGGESEGDGGGGKDAGSGGSDASAGGGSAGAAGSSGGAAGSAGSGGAGGAAGAAGAGGTTSVSCAPPSDVTKAAVCVLLQPEPMKFLPTDPKLDGKGVLVVQLFDTAQVETADGGEVPAVATVVLPTPSSDGGQSEDTLANLTQQPIRFDALPVPSALHARALFFDDTSVLASPVDFPVPGVWIAGIDLGAGLTEDPPLLPVAATAGQGTGVTRKLWALRKLTVQVSRAAGVSPKGNGQGPLGVLVTDKAQVSSTSKVFGTGVLPCADVSGTQKANVGGILFGAGPYWLTAVLDDYGVGSNDLSGALTALELTGGGPKIPAKNQLNFAPDAYAVNATVELDLAFDPPDGGGDAVSCGTADAGGD
ncbi:MAG: hypothetical protein HS104_20090 [Polyangiaceae bacterium]|nr:hypothetical protein [Polyangiaceae bacterium]MCL4756292.1 hypothetical protein [Myxococcales bacterium]